MRAQGPFKKFLLVLLFAVFLNAGYWTTSKAVQTTLMVTIISVCGVTCIFPASFTGLTLPPTQISVNASIAAIIPLLTAKVSVATADFTSTITNKVNDVTKNITDVIEEIWNKNMRTAMQKQSDQLAAISAGQSHDINLLTDAAAHVRAVRELQEQRVRSILEQSVGAGPCVTATVTGGMTRAYTVQRAYNAVKPTTLLGRSGNSTDDPGSVSPAADMKERWEIYLERYCQKDYNNGYAGCDADKPFAGQDIDPAGTIFAKDTIDLTNNDIRQTVDDLVINIAEPFIKDAVAPGAVKSATGQKQILEGESYKAKRQVIYDNLYHIISRRAPGGGTSEFINQLREDAGVNPEQFSERPSHNEIMQVMMNERFRGKAAGDAQVDEPENNQREMIIQQAFQLMQMSDQLDLMDRYSLLLAAQVSAEIKKSQTTGSATSSAPVVNKP